MSPGARALVARTASSVSVLIDECDRNAAAALCVRVATGRSETADRVAFGTAEVERRRRAAIDQVAIVGFGGADARAHLPHARTDESAR